MKTEDEIQRAHDKLVAIVLREVPDPFESEEGERGRRQLLSVASVLCWILDHEHNTAFAEYLAKIDAFLERAGYRLEREWLQ